MTTDKMQDVFPIVFEFKRGEQPTAEKLTGLVRHTDSAFSRLSQFIGDPWDQTAHSDGTSLYKLSPENLGQTSVARIQGPSDYLSPQGGCWNEKVSGHSILIRLDAYKNSWFLGFPLVKLISGQNITHDTRITSSLLEPLVWPTDIVISGDTGGCLATKVASADLVVAHGNFYVDSYSGLITCYTPPATTITLTIGADKINMFGPGVPWGTHNVIPTWEETINLCSVEWWKDEGGQSYYTLTLPSVRKTSRFGESTSALSNPYPQDADTYADLFLGSDVSWYVDNISTSLKTSGLYSDYRLPQSIAGTMIADDTELPEGFCQLWDDVGQRFIPQVTFRTRNSTSPATSKFNSLILVTPTGWLNSGSHVVSTNKYRLMTTGVSVAENLNYLNMVVRSGHHAGLVDCPTMSYLPPISHDYLSHRYAGYISDTTYEHRYAFRESDIPLNPHAQYLHRTGYNSADLSGNSANAMRGNIVFTGATSSSATDLGLGSGVSAAGGYNTYGLLFGGGDITETEDRNARISMQGMTNETWTSGVARHFPFSVSETGLTSYDTYSTGYYGALTIDSWLGSPLWIRGIKDIGQQTTYGTDDYHKGASIAFDLGYWGEYNYIKLMIPIHDDAGYEAANMPAETGQSISAALSITPALAALSGQKRLSPYQIREFRFRGGAYLNSASNKEDGSLGALSNEKHTVTGTGEFDAYFTSPGMVGCDFLNVYSNAIFFSDTGDGKRTSFTSLGENWMQTNSTVPSGIYFVPRSGSTAPYFNFYDYDSTLVASYNSTSFGYSHGFNYAGLGNVTLVTSGNICLGLTSNVATTASSTDIYMESTNSTSIGSNGSVYSFAGGTRANRLAAAIVASTANYAQYVSTLGNTQGIGIATFGSTSPITLATATSNINLIAGTGSDINLTAADDINLVSTDDISLSSSGTTDISSVGTMTLDSNSGNMILNSNTSMNLRLDNDTDNYIQLDGSTDQIWTHSAHSTKIIAEGQVYITGGSNTGASGPDVVTTGGIRLQGGNEVYLLLGNTDGIYCQLDGATRPFTLSNLEVRTSSSGARPLYIDISNGNVFIYQP